MPMLSRKAFATISLKQFFLWDVWFGGQIVYSNIWLPFLLLIRLSDLWSRRQTFWKLLTVLMVCVAISFCPLKVHWSKSKWIPHDAISVQSYLIESSIWLCWKKNSCNVGMVFCFEKCLNYREKLKWDSLL